MRDYKKTNRSHRLTIDFDARWKELIIEFTDQFILYFFPTLYPLVDFSQDVEFIEQELLNIFPEETLAGKKVSDKLLKVKLLNGTERWLLIHIEIEGKGNSNYGQQMFKYYYRIFDKYNIDITAIVIYVGSKIPRNYNYYETGVFGTKIRYDFNAYCIAWQKEDALLQSANLFALAILANWYVLKTRNKYTERLTAKEHLVRLMREKNYSDETIYGLLLFIKYLLTLPKELETQFETYLFTELKNQPMITQHPDFKNFIDRGSRAFYGKTIEEMEQEKRTMEQEKRTMEQEKKQAEKKTLKIEQEKKKMEQEKKHLAEKSVLSLYQKAKLNAADIAQTLDLSVEFVTQILQKNNMV